VIARRRAQYFVIGLGLLTLTAASALAQGNPNSLTPDEAKQGWKLLFDGKSLAGWEARTTSAPPATGDWVVQNGTLVCPGTTAGWIGSTQMFADYKLSLEFRGSDKVNSGVFLRSQKEGQPHITGYELQIWDYQPQKYNTGSLVGTAFASPAKVIGDDWNRYEVTADGDHFVAILNSKPLLDVHDSKHLSPGAIGFQCQVGNKIEFRNVKVLPIKH
jgi:hypothetical protein